MEQKINIAELLKDCPSGMELDCTLFEGLEFDSIVDNEFLPIRCRVKNPNGGYNGYNFTKYGCWLDATFAKCVIFPKGKTTWEGFVPPCKFKEGDIIFTHANCLKIGLGNTWISIYRENRNGGVATYVDYAVNGNNYYGYVDGVGRLLCMENDILRQRLATEEEKAKLFQAIKDSGYKWNAETKTLEKLVKPKFKVGDRVVKKDGICAPVLITRVGAEYYYSNAKNSTGVLPIAEQDDWELVPNKFDITTLKPFDKVLYRMHCNDTWLAGFYNVCIKNKIFVIGLGAIPCCIPYESNEHLLGTTDDCDEFYKTWK